MGIQDGENLIPTWQGSQTFYERMIFEPVKTRWEFANIGGLEVHV